MALFDKEIRALKPRAKPFTRTDERGLGLTVLPSGTKTWQYRYRFDGKQKTLSLGEYPARSLQDARSKRDEAKGLLLKGIDPDMRMNPRRAEAIERAKAAAEKTTNFATVAHEWFALQIEGERWAPAYLVRVRERIENHLIPSLGDKDMAEITVKDVLATLREMEAKELTNSVRKVKGYLGGIMRYAVVEGMCAADLTRDIGDGLRPLPPGKNRPSVPFDQLPEFFRDMARPHEDAELTRIALRLNMHTVLRSTELRSGSWDQVKGDEWHVPEGQMKRVKGESLPHIVPLSRQSLALLDRLREITGGKGRMFPGERPGKIMSENTVLFCIYGMGWKGRACGHGFRTTFSTHANESGEWNTDWVEMQLAHIERNQVRGAYNKALYLPHRHKLMQWWSDELDRMEAIAAERTALEDELSDILG